MFSSSASYSSSSSNSNSIYCLTQLTQEKNCFVTFNQRAFQAQLQARDHGQGCMVFALEWSTDSSASSPSAQPPAASPSSTSSSAASTPLSVTRRVYVGWLGEYMREESNGRTGSDDSSASIPSIGIPSQFASLLGIPAGLRVQVTLMPDRLIPSGGPMISLEPLTSDDWEILELNTGAVEMSLLSQAQVLNPNQVIPFWLGSGVRIKLKNATPSTHLPYMKLTLNSEISIIPKPRPSKRSPASSSSSAVVPSGPPPPIVKLRVQPRDGAKIRAELEEQIRTSKAELERRKDELRDARWRQWEAQQDDLASGFDPSRPMFPPTIETASIPTPLITLASPHYVHVSQSTMDLLGTKPDDLVVISYTRLVQHHAPPPALPQPPTQETLTAVVRVSTVSHVAVGDATVNEVNTASVARHIILSPALRIFFKIKDFASIHLQKLTPHSSQSHPHHPIKQSLCVRESLQRLQNIRLKEIDVQLTGKGAAGINKLAKSGNSNNPSSILTEEDAQLVSDTFISYIRSSTASAHTELSSSLSISSSTIPVPFVNGGIVQLQVPIGDTLNGRKVQPTKRRFFAVYFNEPDLMAAQGPAGAKTLSSATASAGSTSLVSHPKPALSTRSSLLDTSVLESPPTPSFHQGDIAGLKVSMATPFFLLQAPTIITERSKSVKKAKKGTTVVIPPLPIPVLHINKVKVELVIDEFEQCIELLNEVDLLLYNPLDDFTPFDSLGGSPTFKRNVLEPIIRHLKSCLCRQFIADRSEVLHRFDSATHSVDLPPPHAAGGLMVTGSSGQGKSTILRALCHLLRYAPNPVGCVVQPIWLDCKEFIGRKLSEFRTWLTSTLKLIVESQPNPIMVVLDDLDKLCPLTDEHDAGNLRSAQLAELLVDQIQYFQCRYPDTPVAFLSTALNVNSHHPLLSAVFPHFLDVPNPSSIDRVAIVEAIAARENVKLSQAVDRTTWIGRKTEGYTASDLKQLVHRMIHSIVNRRITQPTSMTAQHNQPHDSSSTALVLAHKPIPTADMASAPSSSPLVIERVDLDSAFKGFVPSSLKDLVSADGSEPSQSSEDDNDWESIGGMFELKQTLLDTFELPVRYAELFALAPLKLRSGLLLYGPSGCGKTFLASKIAKKCGLNFISVKGPELLNKYIGSSEQNVRDIFTRARNAAPALLFFDEMDSIVPARGGDSTGVTDRVVNQFLCELDGVEGKISGAKQLYVLGASSRPDLIDPALLRPGRLDKTIYCGLPNQEERVDMMKRMIRKLSATEDIDLSYIAARTENYTPADLQAIITNAQMGLVQQVIADAQQEIQRAKESGAASAPTPNAPLVLPPLTQDHLVASLNESKPSTSEAERNKFDKIYRKFRLNREDTGEVNEFDPTKKQKQALA